MKFIEPLKISVTQRLTTNNNTGMLTIRKDGKKIGVDRYETSSAVAYKNQEYKEREARSEIEIFFEVTECGAQCVSSLSIHMEVVDDSINVTHYVIGSGTAIKLRITVNNTADPAYWTNSYLRMPDFIKLGNAPSECNSYEIRNQTEIKCYLGNVIEKNTPVSFLVMLILIFRYIVQSQGRSTEKAEISYEGRFRYPLQEFFISH